MLLGEPGAACRRPRPGFQSPLWGLDECFMGVSTWPERRARNVSFSPLYGDWMSASCRSRGRRPTPGRRFSPLYGDWMSASTNPWRGRGNGVHVQFQSPLWGLDECFQSPAPTDNQQPQPSGFSPLYGDWMSASDRDELASMVRRALDAVSVPFMGIG